MAQRNSRAARPAAPARFSDRIASREAVAAPPPDHARENVAAAVDKIEAAGPELVAAAKAARTRIADLERLYGEEKSAHRRTSEDADAALAKLGEDHAAERAKAEEERAAEVAALIAAKESLERKLAVSDGKLRAIQGHIER